MKKLTSSVLLISFAVTQPMNATQILPTLQKITPPNEFIEQRLCPSGVFDIAEARRFLFQLKSDVKNQYGTDLDLQILADEAIRIMTQTCEFTCDQIDVAKTLYVQIISPKEMTACKGKRKKNKQPELVLPDKMAMGFIFILGGVLLCCIPSGISQGLGTSLIGSGIYAITESSREGEKPYYVDSETKEPLSSNNQITSPSIGVGTGF